MGRLAHRGVLELNSRGVPAFCKQRPMEQHQDSMGKSDCTNGQNCIAWVEDLATHV